MTGVLKRFVWVAYDHLGGLVMANLLWGLLGLPWLAAGLALAVAGAALGGGWFLVGLFLATEMILLSPPSVALVLFGLRWARGQEAAWSSVLREARRFGWRAQALGLIGLGLTVVLVVNVAFYSRFGGWVGLALGGMAVWALLAVSLIAVHLLPALVLLDGTVGATVRVAAGLAVRRPLPSAGLLAATAATIGLGLASGIGLLCGLLSLLFLLVAISSAEALGWPGGPPRPEDSHRGLDDLLHPWRSSERT